MAPRAPKSDEAGLPESDRTAGLPPPRQQTRLFGHADAARSLASAARSGQLHHAWLISGPKGVGKATLAWHFARALLAHGRAACPDDLDVDPAHQAARLLGGLAHPDATVLRRPWDSDNKRFKADLPVDEVRRLKGFFSRHPSLAEVQVAIVDCADDMNVQAQNALLKILEEPPKAAILLLLSHAPGQLLPTIRSRCRTLALRPLPAAAMHEALRHLVPDAPPDQLEVASVLAEGAPGEAAVMITAGVTGVYRDAAALLETLPRLHHATLHGFADRTVKQLAERTVPQVCSLLSLLMQRHLRCQMGTATPLGFEQGVFARMGQAIPAADWSTLWSALQAAGQRAENLNQDKKQFVLNAFYSIESAIRS